MQEFRRNYVGKTAEFSLKVQRPIDCNASGYNNTEFFKDSSQNLNQNSARKNNLLQKVFVYIMDGLDCLGRCRSSVAKHCNGAK